jgi:hypothetical protein
MNVVRWSCQIEKDSPVDKIKFKVVNLIVCNEKLKANSLLMKILYIRQYLS